MFKRKSEEPENLTMEDKLDRVAEGMRDLFTQSPSREDVRKGFAMLCSQFDVQGVELEESSGCALMYTPVWGVDADGDPAMVLSFTYVHNRSELRVCTAPAWDSGVFLHGSGIPHVREGNGTDTLWMYSFTHDSLDYEHEFLLLLSTAQCFQGFALPRNTGGFRR